MIYMNVEKLKRKIRKMEFYQKIELMDWLNGWYESVKADEIRYLLEEEE